MRFESEKKFTCARSCGNRKTSGPVPVKKIRPRAISVFIHMVILLTGLMSATEMGSIRGFVTDAANGEKLVFANVYLENTDIGTVTNDKGYYYLPSVPQGAYQLIFSYIGFESVKKSIIVNPDQSLMVNAELKSSAIEIPGVTATAERTRFEKTVEISHTNITRRELNRIPTFLDADLIKSVQLMPGVMPMHDLSNKLYVRGGSPDENLVLLDGIIVYNPSSHLFGLFSTFNPDAVNEVELYAGGFPARYGDRLSSVLDITTREGNTKRWTGEVSAGLVTSRILVEGPIPGGSVLFSGRRTYFDALVWTYAHLFNKDVNLPYYFYDGVMKVNLNSNLENRFTLTVFGGADNLSFDEIMGDDDDFEMIWGNRGASLRWRRVFTPRLYGETKVVWSNFRAHFYYTDHSDSTNNLHYFEEIRSFLGKADFNYQLDPRHTLDAGLQIEDLRVSQNWELESGTYTQPELNSDLVDIYLQDNWQAAPPLLSLTPGARFMYYSSGNRVRIDPRFGLKYLISPNTAFNFSAGKYSQFLVTVNSQESYFSIFDFWRPLDKTHAPPYALQAITGLERWLGHDTKLTAEVYCKRYYNLLIPSTSDLFFSEPTESLDAGDGYAAGLDLYFKKNWENFFGWASYSLGFTRRRVDGQAYFPGFDRRHNLNLVAGLNIPAAVPILRGGTMSLRWLFGTGLPYAGEIGRYKYYGDEPWHDPFNYEWRYLKGPRDVYRLPVSHRLDAHLEKSMKLFGLKGSWYVDVMNVYAHENVLFYEWEYYDDHGQELNPPRKKPTGLLPIPIPSLGINFKF